MGLRNVQKMSWLKILGSKKTAYILVGMNFIMLLSLAMLLTFTVAHAATIMDMVKGRILLQVQQHGEAWYVNPVDGKRYFLGRPSNAYDLMRKLGLGITDSNLAKIPVATTAATPTAAVCRNQNEQCTVYSQQSGGGSNCCGGLTCNGTNQGGTTGYCVGKFVADPLACQMYGQGVGGGDTCPGGYVCDGSGPDGTSGKCIPKS